MSPAPTLDDLERDIARTLRTKADQLTVDTSPFPHTAMGDAASTRVTTSPADSRRLLAIAAVMVLLAGGAAIALGWRADSTEPAGRDAAGAPEAWLDETIAFWPAGDDWEPLAVTPFTNEVTAPTTWQLFGREAGGSPIAGGVLVGSTQLVDGGSNALDVDTTEDPQYQIHGEWGYVARPRYAGGFPPGTILANWADGTVLHEAVAVGATAAELAAVLNSLEPLDDPTAGFGPPADGSLVSVATATTADEVGSSSELTGPAGDVAVIVEPQAPYGGLLHRLAGTPTDSGTLLVTGGTQNRYHEASFVREDGWFVSAGPSGPDGTDLSVDEVSDLAREARPVMRREVIDWAVEQPVSGSAEVGDWTVRLHGSRDGDTGVCLVPRSGAEVCAPADDTFGGAVSASLPVGDEWIVVAVADAPDRPLVRTAPNARSDLGDRLQGETGRAGGRVVHVVAVPGDVHAVKAGSWDGSRTPYERPAA